MILDKLFIFMEKKDSDSEDTSPPDPANNAKADRSFGVLSPEEKERVNARPKEIAEAYRREHNLDEHGKSYRWFCTATTGRI